MSHDVVGDLGRMIAIINIHQKPLVVGWIFASDPLLEAKTISVQGGLRGNEIVSDLAGVLFRLSADLLVTVSRPPELLPLFRSG